MLNRDEHDTLRQIELNLAAADPGFAALLRTGQRRLLRSRRGKQSQHMLIGLLVLLTYVLLVMGLSGSALAVAALAAGLSVLRRWPIHEQM